MEKRDVVIRDPKDFAERDEAIQIGMSMIQAFEEVRKMEKFTGATAVLEGELIHPDGSEWTVALMRLRDK